MPKKIKFKCSKCGKRAVLGEHFCDSRDIEKYRLKLNYDPDADLGYNPAAAPRQPLTISRPIYAMAGIAGLLVLAGFSYQLFGGLALIALLALATVVVVIRYGPNIAAIFADNSRELLSLCRGDQDLADRLIRAEQLRQGAISKRQATALATRKLLSDRLR